MYYMKAQVRLSGEMNGKERKETVVNMDKVYEILICNCLYEANHKIQ